MKKLVQYAVVLLLLSAFNASFSTARAQGTAFTYQGRLNDGGNPANGGYDLRFYLRDALTAGNPVGTTNTLAPVAASNGLFTVTLDFSNSVFPGAARWLEIGVRTNGSVSAYTTLSPRQPILSVPYAITAGNLTGTLPAAQLSGAIANGNLPASPTFSGTVTAATFVGSGANLINLNPVNIAGIIPFAGLPSSLVTNTAGGVTLGGAFNGNGAGLTNLNAAQLTGGTVPLARLSGITSNQLDAATWQVATNLGGGFAALASNVVSGISITNAFITNSIFAGNGAGLTNLNAAQLTGGTVPLAQLPAAVVTNNNVAGVTLSGTFSGNGANVTNVNAAQLGGLDSSYFWQLGGNNVTAGQFLGSTNNQAVEIRADGVRGLRLEPNNGNGMPNVIGGSPLNFVAGGVVGATIGGGGGAASYFETDFPNSVTDDFGTVGGGAHNTASGFFATVGGGEYHTASTNFATVGGGESNTAGGFYSTVGGGAGNIASGNSATIPGGDNNAATDYAFAAGHSAKANHTGSFVWGDYSTLADFATTATNQFLIRATGGVGINTNNPNGASLYVVGNRVPPAGNSGWAGSVGWFENTSTATNAAPALRVVCDGGTNADGALSVSSNGHGLIAEFGNAGGFVVTITNDGTIYSKGLALTSDRNAKEHFTALDGRTVLAKVVAMPVTEWNYKDDAADKKHIGPMAQDFHAAFQLDGMDDKHISVVDEGGVALAAIQGLNENFESGKQKAEIQIEKLEAENAELKQRLEALEKIMHNQNQIEGTHP